MGAAIAVLRNLEPWRELVQLDFTEMPGMKLTLPQAQRLWMMDADTCRAVLDSLVESQFLTCVDVRYCRPGSFDAAWLHD